MYGYSHCFSNRWTLHHTHRAGNEAWRDAAQFCHVLQMSLPPWLTCWYTPLECGCPELSFYIFPNWSIGHNNYYRNQSFCQFIKGKKSREILLPCTRFDWYRTALAFLGFDKTLCMHRCHTLNILVLKFGNGGKHACIGITEVPDGRDDAFEPSSHRWTLAYRSCIVSLDGRPLPTWSDYRVCGRFAKVYRGDMALDEHIELFQGLFASVP